MIKLIYEGKYQGVYGRKYTTYAFSITLYILRLGNGKWDVLHIPSNKRILKTRSKKKAKIFCEKLTEWFRARNETLIFTKLSELEPDTIYFLYNLAQEYRRSK